MAQENTQPEAVNPSYTPSASTSRHSSSTSSTTANNDVAPTPSRGDAAASLHASDRKKNSHFGIILDQAGVTNDVLHHKYPGHGTTTSPYEVDFLPNDPRNPMTFSAKSKWSITILQALATLAVSFTSSVYSGAVTSILEDFRPSEEVAILGVSMFVVGFAIGPLIWAPLSELYGRQKLLFFTYMALTAFNAGSAGAPNMAALVTLRFFGGAFGSSPLTNSGGVIADMFPATQRGIATSIFAMAPFLGPALGKIVPTSCTK